MADLTDIPQQHQLEDAAQTSNSPFQDQAPATSVLDDSVEPPMPHEKDQSTEQSNGTAAQPFEQAEGSDSVINGTPNIYRNSATPPGVAQPLDGGESEQETSTDIHRSDDAQVAALTDSAPVVAQIPPLASSTPLPQEVLPNENRPSSTHSTGNLPPAAVKTRLPQDRIGQLEDRVAEDARGESEAWLELIEEYQKRGKLEETRKTYERFLEIFPSAAEVWIAYVSMELDNDNFWQAEQLFGRVLTGHLPSVALWTTYLNYIRRRYSLNNDPDGKHRKVISEAFEHVLREAGGDRDSANLWMEYIQFLKSMPGNVNGTTWQDQQKKDSLRAGYRKAICVPHGNIGIMWTEYTKFEIAVDRPKSSSVLQQHSPNFMQARSARHSLENMIQGLNPTTIARLPPALGFEGDVEYMKQVEIWKQWVEWEKTDPLVFRPSELENWKKRVLYVYKQALMPLRYWPEMWFSAVQFCLAHNLEEEGDKLLSQATTANPESCLLAFQRGDRIETSTASESKDKEGLKRRGDAVRKPYDDVINALYRLIEQTQERQARDITRMEEAHAQRQQTNSRTPSKLNEDDDADEVPAGPTPAMDAQMVAQIEAIKRGHAAQIEVLKKTLSFGWIALMRAMRRVQGQGVPSEDEPVRGLRGTFSDARKRGKLTSDVYVASALIEHHCFQDKVAQKLFERGFKLFPQDVEFALAYIKHLFDIQDTTNARAVFKTTAGRLERDASTAAKAKPLYAFWHDYESRYGELNLLKDLEQQMSELFPEDPKLALFASRYSAPTFDPCAIRPVVSPGTQTRPKALPSVEHAGAGFAQDSPRPSASVMASAFAGIPNSPKRALDESDTESLPPRKMMRADSPLKGAAGRRLDAAKRSHMRNELGQVSVESTEALSRSAAGPTNHPVHPSIYNLLKVLPSSQVARSSQLQPALPVPLVMDALIRADLSQFNHERLVSSIAQGANPLAQMMAAPPPQHPTVATPIPGWQPNGPPPPPPGQYGYGQPPYMYR